MRSAGSLRRPGTPLLRGVRIRLGCVSTVSRSAHASASNVRKARARTPRSRRRARWTAGLGAYVAGKTCILILYLCVFGLTTEWMGSEVAIAICYIVYSLASTYVALMLFNALSMGGYSAAVAGFSEGCQDEEEEQTPLRQQQQQPGYQTQSQYI